MRVQRNMLPLALAAFVFQAALVVPAQTPNGKPATPIAASAPTAVPALVPFSGLALGPEGKPLAADAAVTFLIFKDEQGGEPLWAETQPVEIDPAGHYKVELGGASVNGLPADLFSTGEARWLEVQVAGEKPQPRVLLASVPYALKAGDATTLGGLPVSAFALAGVKPAGPIAATLGASAEVVPTPTDVTTIGGVAGYIPEFSGLDTIIDSPVFVKGLDVGIGTVNPTATLDVAGTTLLHGQTILPALGIATAKAGFNSEPFDFYSSVYSGFNKANLTEEFQWQAEAGGNDSYFPTATLNLLSGTVGTAPAETGFYFNKNGTVHFAAGQTYPGSITGITAGTGLTGGGTSGAVTLKVDTTKLPLLGGNNTFAGNQTVNGSEIVQGGVESPQFDMPATSGGSSGLIEIGGVPFLHGYGAAATYNTFVGGAGNFSTTGSYTTAVGYQALKVQSSGSSNTAMGLNSLIADTAGGQNTAVGAGALYSITTGSNNTAIGWSAGANDYFSLSNTTAVGASAYVAQSNSLVLGNTTSSPGAEFVNVGVGTGTPVSAMELSVGAAGALGPVLTLTNPQGDTPKAYGAAAIDFNTQPIARAGNGYLNPGARIEAVDDGQNSDSIDFLFNKGTAKNGGMTTLMSIDKNNIFIAGGLGVDMGDIDSIVNPGSSFNVGSVGIQTAGGQNANGTGNGGDGIQAYGGSNGHGGTGGVFEGGLATTGGDGVEGIAGMGTNAGYAGVFQGDVTISGSVVASSKNFKIDHPQDPANKYLVHASIESSEMVNIYSGNVVTDELGLAVVRLPDWFEAENGDFRYQLTVIGQDAHVWIAEEIAGKQFKIATNPAHVKVSWQVTGVRQDAWAKAHPLVVEQEKNDRERGFYIHPELYGQPEEKQTEWGRHPEMMRRMKAHREAVRQAPRAEASGIQPQVGPPASAVDRTFAPAPGPTEKTAAKPKPKS